MEPTAHSFAHLLRDATGKAYDRIGTTTARQRAALPREDLELRLAEIEVCVCWFNEVAPQRCPHDGSALCVLGRVGVFQVELLILDDALADAEMYDESRYDAFSAESDSIEAALRKRFGLVGGGRLHLSTPCPSRCAVLAMGGTDESTN